MSCLSSCHLSCLTPSRYLYVPCMINFSPFDLISSSLPFLPLTPFEIFNVATDRNSNRGFCCLSSCLSSCLVSCLSSCLSSCNLSCLTLSRYLYVPCMIRSVPLSLFYFKSLTSSPLPRKLSLVSRLLSSCLTLSRYGFRLVCRVVCRLICRLVEPFRDITFVSSLVL